MTAPALNVYVNGGPSVSGDGFNTFCQTCDSVANLRGFVGVQGVQVYMRGTLVPNDGGEGNFYWNSTGSAADDNGVTTIIPSGSVAGSGEWTRITSPQTSVISASATGINAIVLTSLKSAAALVSYSNYQMFSFVVPASTTGAVTIQYDPTDGTPLAALPLYLPNLTQAGAGSLTAGSLVLIAYVSSLNSGNGGFQLLSVSAASFTSTIVVPQGRLTLVSGTPVLNADSTAVTTIYYTPYIGSLIPIYNGSVFSNQTFVELPLALDSNTGHTGYQASGSLYDLFVFSNSGIVTLGTGPAWTSSTGRGTGAGTTQLQQVSGIWTNAVSIALRTGSAMGNTVTVAANLATYVGTMYATANGQTSMTMHPAAAAGGTANFLALWNAYNRVTVSATCWDNTTSWTYGTNTVRAANASTSNSISFVDGLRESNIAAEYTCLVSDTSGTPVYGIAIGVDSASTVSSNVASGDSASSTQINAIYRGYPLLGLHFVQALENDYTGSGTVTFFGLAGGVGQNMQLSLSLDM